MNKTAEEQLSDIKPQKSVAVWAEFRDVEHQRHEAAAGAFASGDLSKQDSDAFFDVFCMDIDAWSEAQEHEPAWYRKDLEHQYRKGFHYGVIEAMRMMVRLYRKGGYVRVQEIANIMGVWAEELRAWRNEMLSTREEDIKDVYDGEPLFKWESWPSIRKRVFDRDVCCTSCGSLEDLHAHHVDAVKDGGLPVLENLTTLCEECHRKFQH